MKNSRLHHDIRIQFGLTHDCIRACVFCDHIARARPTADAWISLADICYSDAVITWAQLFGTDSEDTHWKNFVAKLSSLPPDLKAFSSFLICEYLEIEKRDWESFHTQMVQTRNKRLAHIDRFHDLGEFPGLDWAARSCYLYREWLLKLLDEATEPNADAENEPHSGREIMEIFKRHISEVCPG